MGANSVLLRFLDDDLTIVLLANSNATDLDAFAFTIGRSVLQ
jgi:D-alanyl-D-alanine carboxypeptidase